MTQIELNAVLYYADYLSLRDTSHPITDMCKYFFVHNHPINASYLAGCEPEFDEENEYIIKSYDTYSKIQNSFGDEAVDSFIEDICFLRACGMVDATRML